MFHFVYKITNTIDGKFYIGKHSTNNLNFFMKVTQMTIRGFDGLLRGIEYSYNRKGTHRKALKAIGLMEQKNTRDCFEIVESNWDFTA